MADAEPAVEVVMFADWLKERNILPPAKVIDIGCGKGRHAVYMASLGYQVYAMDYIEAAVEAAKKLAELKVVAGKITFQVAAIDREWPFEDNFFDIAIDSFSSVDIETRQGREVYRDEMMRTLEPGGCALVRAASTEDEWEKELIAKSPGKELNSTYWPQTGKFQKDYDEAELREFYKDFEILELRTITKPTSKLGRNYTATNFWVVLRKR